MEQGRDIVCRNIERCFKIDLPAVTAQFAEASDKIGTQARFAAAECHAAIGGEEIKLVDANFPIQRFRSIFPESTAIAERLGIEAITAMERAFVESHKRGDGYKLQNQAFPLYLTW